MATPLIEDICIETPHSKDKMTSENDPAGGPVDKWSDCPKFSTHDKFIPLKKFSNIYLEKDYQEREHLCELIESMAKLTGFIEIKTGENTKDIGTGFIQRIRLQRGQCPCFENSQEKCNESTFAILTVSTVVHVFSDVVVEQDKFKINWKPKTTMMTLRYDTEDKVGTKKIYGWKVLETDKELDVQMDWCCVEFVTHDLKLAEELSEEMSKYHKLQAQVYEKSKNSDKLVVVIGHPHGEIKKVSLGNTIGSPEIQKEIRDSQRWGRYKYNTQTCAGSSGSPILILGQPVSGFGYWFGHPHNHSRYMKKENCSLSSIGVDYVVSYL